MPQSHHQPAARQTYSTHGGNDLLSEVASVICLLGPRSLLSAGFNASGAVVLIRRVEAEAACPSWDHHFVEAQILAEPLLGDPGVVRAVLFAGEHLLQVPGAMYDKAEAAIWARHLWSVGDEERVLHCRSERDIYLLTAVPTSVTAMMEGFFANAKLMPLAVAHLYKPNAEGAVAQCTLTDNLATATLHTDGKLLWQQAFPCATPEDAAYQLLIACGTAGLSADKLTVSATADAPYQIGTLEAMSEYLPGLRTSSSSVIAHDPDWAPVLTLLHQLYACAL